ncbi:MAG: IclR family transcriptional regulator [Leifsonia sp.]
MSARSGSPREKPAESARKALEMLLLFDEDQPTLTVAAMADAVGVPLSTTYRYVAILRDMGLLEATDRGAYQVGDRVVPLARAARAGRGPLLGHARPVMEALRDACDETVVLVRRTGDMAFCLDIVESQQAVRLSVETGRPMVLHEGSSPRVLLACMPAAERAAYLDRVRAQDGALASQLDERELDRVAELGFTESYEELSDGIWGTAAVIRDGETVVASLGVAGPLFRLTAEQRQAITERTRSAAAQISAALETVSL